jgi:hypothetical protein
MVIDKGLSRVLVAGLAIVLGPLLLLSPAQAATGLKSTDIYNPLKILRIDLDLPAETVASLNEGSTVRKYVPGTITMSVDGRSSGAQKMDIRLKGTTSISTLNETPSFKVKFPAGPSGTGYLGFRRLTLNALIQDTSKIHEFGAYALFNAMGVPASKTGWANVYVNGQNRGLYVSVEQPDHNFVAKRFKDITQHIYEGVALKDFKKGNADGDSATGAFLADYGWKVTPNKNDLDALLKTVDDWDSARWYKALPKVMDRSALIKLFAVENFLGHWDGYTGPNINNYFIRSNTQGKFTMIPWGTDQTFGENRQTEILGDSFNFPMLSYTSTHPWQKRESTRGSLYTNCISYNPCRNEYLKELKAVSAMATKIKLADQMKSAAKLIKPVLALQFSTEPKLFTEIGKEQTRSISFITLRQKDVAALAKQYKIK